MWLQQGDYNLESLYWLIGIGVIFVIALAALIIAIVALVRLSSMAAAKAETPSEVTDRSEDTEPAVSTLEPRTPEALRLLDGRYANGEISRDQYLQLESDLMSTARRATSAGDMAQAQPPSATPTESTQKPSAAVQSTGRPETPVAEQGPADIGDWGG